MSQPALTFVVARSNTELGKAFNQLIHTEILPTIRKTGSYQAEKAIAPSQEKFDFVKNVLDAVFSNVPINPVLVNGILLNAAQELCPEVKPLLEPARQLLIQSTAQDTDHVLLTPTEIGKQLGISAQKVNQLLVEKGLQVKNPDKKSRKDLTYVPTDRGHEFASLTLSTGKGKDSTTYQQLRWDKQVLTVI